MPLKRCTKDGKSGWKWGNRGHCYTGEGAKERALKQMRAIKAHASALVHLRKRKEIQLESDSPR